jgi:hypothetical protein
MSSKRLYFIFLGLIGLLFIGLIAGTYGANNLLGTQADKLTALKAKNQALNQEQQSLANAKRDIQKYGDLEKIAKIVVPQDKNQAEAVREIVNLAGANGVNLASITFPSSTLGSSTTATPTTSGATVTSPNTPSPAGNPKSSFNALSQLQPIKNIPGVYLLQITLANDDKHAVGYFSFINFLSSLEHNRRTAQVSTISLQPSTINPNVFTFSLTLNEYIKP